MASQQDMIPFVIRGKDMGAVVSLASERHRADTAKAPIGTMSAFDADLMGAIAEFGVCRHYGVEPMWDVLPAHRGQGGEPDIWLDGWQGSIKGTRHSWRFEPCLMLRPHDTKMDVYILASVYVPIGADLIDAKEFRGWLVGYATRAMVLAKDPEPFPYKKPPPPPSRNLWRRELKPCQKRG